MKEFFLSLLDIFKAMPFGIFDFLCFWFPFLEDFRND